MVIMKTKKLKDITIDDPTEQKEEIPKNILVIAQEVKIVQSLACNDVNKRNKQIRKLRKWLTLRAQSSFAFTEDDFLRIWKGLYYNMWMSDKPLVQEELTEELGKLVECFGDVQLAVNFFGAFLRTMCNEWFGIDQWRIDKFLMLVRRMLRYMLRVLRTTNWKKESVELFNQHIFQSLLTQTSSTGLTMHFLDIFFEELAKVSEGKIEPQQMGTFIKPFVWLLKTQSDLKLLSHCRTRVFYHLLYQSALGREYQEKYNAWKEMGFPTASINDLEKVETNSVDETEESEQNVKTDAKHLDPRAGNVDVFMPELPLDGQLVIHELELALKEVVHTKRRKMLRKLLEIFQTYQNGEFPLGVKTMPRFEGKSEKPLIKEKIRQLENLENEMFSTGRKLKQLTKRKRRKLLKSLNFTDIDESNFEQVIEKSIPKQYLKERKKKFSLLNNWLEEEIATEPPKKVRKTEIEETNDKAPQTIKKTKKKVKNIESATQKEKRNNHVSASGNENEPEKLKTIDEPVDIQNNTAATKQSVKLLATAANTITSPKIASETTIAAGWHTPLAEGEFEYFIPSRKIQLKKAQESLTDLVRNPFVKKNSSASKDTLRGKKKIAATVTNSPKTPSSIKRVKIALKHNTEQKPCEYIKQIKRSPNLPFDANKKPGKGLLKPNSIPSPINPFYKKKIGLRLLNDSI